MTQKDLQALLEDSRQAGIYRLPHGDRRALRDAAEAAGFACFEADLGDSDQIHGVLTRLGRQLGFPEWYGGNFDALKDCLSDISWREECGYLLILSRAEPCSSRTRTLFGRSTKSSPRRLTNGVRKVFRCGFSTTSRPTDWQHFRPWNDRLQATGIGPGCGPYPDLQVLLLERASHAGYWQSVTGSQEAGEALARHGAA
jgi:hypothetical protein